MSLILNKISANYKLLRIVSHKNFHHIKIIYQHDDSALKTHLQLLEAPISLVKKELAYTVVLDKRSFSRSG